MDSLLAKSAGKAKAVKARVDGLVGVFSTLAAQHGAVKTLMERLQHDPAQHAALWPEIRKALISHERGEMRAVFPLMRLHVETRELANHHADEAEELETLIAQIDEAGDGWRPLFEQLQARVIAHAIEEEQMIFPTAQRVLGADIVSDMDDAFRAAQNAAKYMA